MSEKDSVDYKEYLKTVSGNGKMTETRNRFDVVQTGAEGFKKGWIEGRKELTKQLEKWCKKNKLDALEDSLIPIKIVAVDDLLSAVEKEAKKEHE